MSIYDLNYYQKAYEAMPVNKRLPIYKGWLYSLIYPMVWLRNVVFDLYKSGLTYSEYTAGTYSKGDRVYYAKSIYESLIDSNTDAPTTDNWLKIVDNFIGVDERILFRSEKIVFEYALNKWFNTDSEPCVWSNIAGDSTIYISNNTVTTGFFRVGTSQDLSSYVGRELSSEPIGNDGGIFAIQYSYTINLPTIVWTALGADDDIREQTIRNFADKYNVVGLFYNIVTY